MATSQNDIELASIRSTDLDHAAPSRTESTAAINPARVSSRQAGEEEPRDEDQPPANREAFDSYPENAWSLVAACSILFSTSVGGIYSWGVLQSEIVKGGLAPSSTVVYIGSAQACLQAAFAIPTQRLVAHYGARNIALVGSSLISLGPLLASFCTNSLAGLVITEGLLFGAGQCLIFHAVAPLASSYFKRRRNIATGIVYAGGGVGGAVFSIVAAQLLNHTTLPNTFRALGGMFALLNFPSALVLKSRAAREPFLPQKKILDWSLFKDLRFILFFFGFAIAIFPLFVPPFFLPIYAENALGLSNTTSSLLLALYNLFSGVGRLAFGLSADTVFGSVNSLVICLALVSISSLVIWPVATSLPPLIAFAVLNGISAGGLFSLIPGAISTIFGSHRLSPVFSLLVSAGTPGYLLGSPIAGMLIPDNVPKGDFAAYRSAIFYSGALSAVSTVLIALVRLQLSKKVFKRL